MRIEKRQSKPWGYFITLMLITKASMGAFFLDNFHNDNIRDADSYNTFWTQTSGSGNIWEGDGWLHMNPGANATVRLSSQKRNELDFIAPGSKVRFVVRRLEMTQNSNNYFYFDITSDANNHYDSANDGFRIEVQGNGQIYLRKKVNGSATTLASHNNGKVPKFFKLELNETSYELKIYYSFNATNPTVTTKSGTFGNISTSAWGSNGDSALHITAKRTGSGNNYLKVADIYAKDDIGVYTSVKAQHVTLRPPGVPNDSYFQKGIINVKQAPYNAKGDNSSDDWRALQSAIIDAYEYNLTCYIPAGTYRISKTLHAMQKVYLLENESSGRITEATRRFVHNIVGNRDSRPVIKIRNGASWSTDQPMIRMFGQRYRKEGNGYDQTGSDDPNEEQANLNFNNEMRNIVFDTNGVSGAIGVQAQGAQGTSIDDIKVIATGSKAAFKNLSGVGGGAFNLEAIGGQYGIYVPVAGGNASQNPQIIGLTLLNQTANAVYYQGLGPLTMVGVRIEKNNGTAIRTVNPYHLQSGMIGIVDGSIRFTGSGTRRAVDNNNNQCVYFRNVYVQNSSQIIDNPGTNKDVAGQSGVRLVNELAYNGKNTRGVGRSVIAAAPSANGSKGPDQLAISDVTSASSIPGDLVSRHIWDRLSFPEFYDTDIINVKDYGAKGNGSFDDWPAINSAINAANSQNKKVFVPKGMYRVSKQITLQANTVFFGLGKQAAFFEPTGAFPKFGYPVFKTVNNKDGRALLAYVNVLFSPNYENVVFDWKVGRNSMVRGITAGIRVWGGFQAYPSKVLQVSGNGGGRIYAPIAAPAETGVLTGNANFRYFYAINTSEPLHIYALNVERMKSEPMIEFKDSSNIFVYGMKAENDTQGSNHETCFQYTNCDNVAFFGYGGIAKAPAGKQILKFKDCTNFVAGNIGVQTAGGYTGDTINDYNGNTKRNRVAFDDMATIFKRGNPQIVYGDGSASGSGGNDTDAIAFAQTPPTTVEQGQTYPIHIDWSTAGSRTVEVCLLLNSDPYTIHSNIVTKSASSGQSNPNDVFNITVDADAPSPCRWRIRLLDGTTTVVPNVVQTNVTVDPAPAVDSIAFAQTPPSTVEAGQSYPIHVNWSAAAGRSVEVVLLLDTDPYSTHSTIATKAVSSGQSNADDVFNVMVDSDAPSPCRWRIRLLDGAGAAVVSNVVQMGVSVTPPPAVDSIAFAQTPPTTIDQGGTYPIHVNWSAAGTRTIEVVLLLNTDPYTIYSTVATKSASNGQSNADDIFNVSVDPGAPSPCRWRIRLLDGSGGMVVPNVVQTNVTVNYVNRPPVLNAIANQSVNEAASVSVSLSASDPDGNPLSFSASGLPSFGSLVDNGNGTGSITFNPGYNNAGTYSIGVSVSDGNGGVANRSFTLTVNDVNRNPTLNSIAAQSVNEGSTISIGVSASDPDAGDSLILSASIPAFASLVDNGDGTGSINVDPGYNDSGSYSATVTASDGNGGSASRTFTITVVNVNQLPSISNIAVQSVEEGQSITINISSSDPDTNDVLTLSATGLPSFANLVDNGDGTGSINVSPNSGDAGTSNVSVSVSDGTDSDQTSFSLTVTEPPVVDSIAFASAPPSTVTQGQSYTVSVDWSSSGNYTVEVSLVLDASPYSTHSSVAALNVASNQTGTDNFTVSVNADAPSACRWQIRLLDGSSAVVPNVIVSNVTVEPESADPLDGAIVTLENVEFVGEFLCDDHDNTYPELSSLNSTSRLGPYVDNNNFKWKLSKVSGQADVYTIESERAADRFLGSAIDSVGNWKYASLHSSNTGGFCQWKLVSLGNDIYSIQNLGNENRRLMRNGSQQGRVTDSENAWGGTGEWILTVVGGGPLGTYSGDSAIESFKSPGNYAVPGTLGSNLTSGTSAIAWEFVHVGNEEYEIRIGNNFLEADNSGGWRAVKQNAANGLENQLWIFEAATGGAQGTGNFTLRSKVQYNGQDLHICYNSNNGKFFTTTGGVSWGSCSFVVNPQ